MKFKRFLELPNSSFLLLGPRGTGKSTLIKDQIKTSLDIDLLQSQYFLALSADPSLLQRMVKNLKPGAWVCIDEVQKIPALLDEVHSLYENKKLNFALSGSSARKLRRQGANLLAGRALSQQLFPLTYDEYSSHYSIDQAIDWGSLPQVVTKTNLAADFLSSYVETYLREELIEEGLLRKLEPFVRFLQICGRYHGQVLNVENVARECFLSRSTVQNYFEILEETLIGYRLPSYQQKLNKKEGSHPKFYIFDAGVARACAGLAHEEIEATTKGFAFEGLIISEVRAYNRYLKKNKNLFYYKYSAGYEIDLLIENKAKTISKSAELTAIEIKNTKKWDKRWCEPLLDLQKKSHLKAGGKIQKLLGVYRGSEILKIGDVDVLPAEEFLSRLAAGKIL
jgi:predicted AAA+ superfamily ATPase